MMPETLTKNVFLSQEEKVQVDERLHKLGSEYVLRLFDAEEINFRKFIDGDTIEIVFSQDMFDQIAQAYIQHRNICLDKTHEENNK